MNAAYIESMMRKVLITGAAGFIGSCLSEHLFRQGYDVVGCDIYNFRNQFFDVGDSHHLRLQKLRYDRIAHFLKKNQIYSTFRYYPLHLINLFQPYADDCSAATVFSNTALNIPIHQSLSDVDVAHIADSLRLFFSR